MAHLTESMYVPVWAPTADAHPPRQLVLLLPPPATNHKRKNRIKNEMEAPRFETHLAEGKIEGAPGTCFVRT